LAIFNSIFGTASLARLDNSRYPNGCSTSEAAVALESGRRADVGRLATSSVADIALMDREKMEISVRDAGEFALATEG